MKKIATIRSPILKDNSSSDVFISQSDFSVTAESECSSEQELYKTFSDRIYLEDWGKKVTFADNNVKIDNIEYINDNNDLTINSYSQCLVDLFNTKNSSNVKNVLEPDDILDDIIAKETILVEDIPPDDYYENTSPVKVGSTNDLQNERDTKITEYNNKVSKPEMNIHNNDNNDGNESDEDTSSVYEKEIEIEKKPKNYCSKFFEEESIGSQLSKTVENNISNNLDDEKQIEKTVISDINENPDLQKGCLFQDTDSNNYVSYDVHVYETKNPYNYPIPPPNSNASFYTDSNLNIVPFPNIQSKKVVSGLSKKLSIHRNDLKLKNFQITEELIKTQKELKLSKLKMKAQENELNSSRLEFIQLKEAHTLQINRNEDLVKQLQETQADLDNIGIKNDILTNLSLIENNETERLENKCESLMMDKFSELVESMNNTVQMYEQKNDLLNKAFVILNKRVSSMYRFTIAPIFTLANTATESNSDIVSLSYENKNSIQRFMDGNDQIFKNLNECFTTNILERSDVDIENEKGKHALIQMETYFDNLNELVAKQMEQLLCAM